MLFVYALYRYGVNVFVNTVFRNKGVCQVDFLTVAGDTCRIVSRNIENHLESFRYYIHRKLSRLRVGKDCHLTGSVSYLTKECTFYVRWLVQWDFHRILF